MILVYVAAPLPHIKAARAVARELELENIDVVSTWHRGKPTVESEAAMYSAERAWLAVHVRRELFTADALVLLYDGRTGRTGAVWEAGYAEGRGAVIVAAPAVAGATIPTALLAAPCVSFVVRHRIVDGIRAALFGTGGPK